MLERYGVVEANWRDGAKKDPFFIHSESPLLVGRCVAALAGDRRAFSLTGQTLGSWELSKRYRVSDYDGRRPDLMRAMRENPVFRSESFQSTFARHVEWLDGMRRRATRNLIARDRPKGSQARANRRAKGR